MNIRYTRGNRGEIVKEHGFVNHSKEYAKDGVHVNTAENRHGFLRAWLRKFRGVLKHYLRNYISFFYISYGIKRKECEYKNISIED